jgi:hypothetical protein
MTDRIPADPFWGVPIHTNTRDEAMADGVLFDVRETAREGGFRVPVALTASVWADVNNLSGKYVSAEQSPEGRLWDLLFLAAHAARRRANRNTNERNANAPDRRLHPRFPRTHRVPLGLSRQTLLAWCV